MRFEFSGRKILLTGANRGIGAALREGLVARGARLLAVGRDPQAMAALAGPDCAVLVEDLSRPGAAARIAAWVEAEHPDCAGLINNAAVMNRGRITPGGLPAGHAAPEITTNLIAPVELCQAMLPILGRQDRAAICNITSGLAITPIPGGAVYAATKAGLRHFTRSLRWQCEDAGLPIGVSDAVMTLVETRMSEGNRWRRYPASRAASEVLDGMEKGKAEIWVEKTWMLGLLERLSPALAGRVMRFGGSG